MGVNCAIDGPALYGAQSAGGFSRGYIRYSLCASALDLRIWNAHASRLQRFSEQFLQTTLPALAGSSVAQHFDRRRVVAKPSVIT
jgi:hypothetical protein